MLTPNPTDAIPPSGCWSFRWSIHRSVGHSASRIRQNKTTTQHENSSTTQAQVGPGPGVADYLPRTHPTHIGHPSHVYDLTRRRTQSRWKIFPATTRVSHLISCMHAFSYCKRITGTKHSATATLARGQNANPPRSGFIS